MKQKKVLILHFSVPHQQKLCSFFLAKLAQRHVSFKSNCRGDCQGTELIKKKQCDWKKTLEDTVKREAEG